MKSWQEEEQGACCICSASLPPRLRCREASGPRSAAGAGSCPFPGASAGPGGARPRQGDEREQKQRATRARGHGEGRGSEKGNRRSGTFPCCRAEPPGAAHPPARTPSRTRSSGAQGQTRGDGSRLFTRRLYSRAGAGRLVAAWGRVRRTGHVGASAGPQPRPRSAGSSPGSFRAPSHCLGSPSVCPGPGPRGSSATACSGSAFAPP